MPSKHGKQNKNTCTPSYKEEESKIYNFLILAYIYNIMDHNNFNTLKMRPMLGRVFRALFLGK